MKILFNTMILSMFSLLGLLFSTQSFASNLSTSTDPRLSTVWVVQVQDICVTYPNKDQAWDLTPSVVENEYWMLDKNSTCMDQKGNGCSWNFEDGMIQIMFPGKRRTYLGKAHDDYLGMYGVVRHDDNPRVEGCWRAQVQQIAGQRKDNNYSGSTLPTLNSLPPPIYDTTNPSQVSPR